MSSRTRDSRISFDGTRLDISALDMSGHYDSVDEATIKVERFLKPVLPDGRHVISQSMTDQGVTRSENSTNASALSLVDRLIQARKEQGVQQSDRLADVDGKWVISHACNLLTGMHQAVTREQSGKSRGDISYSTSMFASVYNLLDFIILEGIYPSLTPGSVSVPERRAKSMFFDKDSIHQPFPSDLNLLESVLYETLDPLIFDTDKGLQPLLRGRIVNDLVAAHTDLAFSPRRTARTRAVGRPKFDWVIEQLPLFASFQILTMLLRPQAPDWFRANVSESLSVLPTKIAGVRNAIEFIASSQLNESKDGNQGYGKTSSQGVSISFTTLSQASKVLSSIPGSMSVESYIDTVGPQLLGLLDGNDGSELAHVAGYVIGHGFLGKRALGAPDTPGWNMFIAPIHVAIAPVGSTVASTSTQWNEKDSNAVLLVSDNDLTRALTRLTTLIKAHTNTALIGRLVRPIILPLWAIAAFDASPIVDPLPKTLAISLLQTFFTLSGGARELSSIASNLLFNGASEWKLVAGSQGAIAIISRHSQRHVQDVSALIAAIDVRVTLLADLMQTSAIADDHLGTLFFGQMQNWIQHRNQVDEHLVESARAKDSATVMATAKIVLKMLDAFGDRIASHPNNALSLIKEIVQRHAAHGLDISGTRVELRTGRRVNEPLYGLPSRSDAKVRDDSLLEAEDDDLDISLSLLQALLSIPSFAPDRAGTAALQDIDDHLNHLASSANVGLQVAARLRPCATSISMYLESLGDERGQKLPETDHEIQSGQTFSQIQADLVSDLPPIRASAITNLKKQIEDSRVAIDVPASAIMLLQIIRSDNEDFVYLAAINALAALANLRDLRLVTRFAVGAFQDVKEETGVDGRLRIAEAVIGVLNGVGLASGPHQTQIITGIIEAATKVASRRGTRQRERKDRESTAKSNRMRRTEAERAMGGPIPDAVGDQPDSDHDGDETPDVRERRAKELNTMQGILKGWEDTGLEEDIRIRSSALNILSGVLERCLDSIHQQQIDHAVDVVLAVLMLEEGPSKIILRRAAVLVILSLLRAMDQAFEQNRELAVGLEASKWMDVEKVLGFIQDADKDDLVRGHAVTVLEGLAAYRMKQLLGVRDGAVDDVLRPRFGLEGKLRGIEIDSDVRNTTEGFSKIQELE